MNQNSPLAVMALGAAFGLVMAGAKAQPLAGQAAHGQSQGEAKTAEQAFKNIQVLKGVPADQLIPTMQFISASLGVECDFCHVQGAFEKDEKKPKLTARKMVEMMFALNADNFDRRREVTCYTCHRGSVRPVEIPAVAGEPAKSMKDLLKPGLEEKANSSPNADQLLNNYLQASGGTSAIDKIRTRVMKGTIDFGGKSFPIEIYSKAPDARISFTHMPEGDSVAAFNGHEGWLGMTGHPVREMHGSDLEAAAIDADLRLPEDLERMFSAMKVLGTEKVVDRETYLVEGERSGKPEMLLYFDKQNGLLLRMLRFAETALGRLPTQIDYADYRNTDGVNIPFRWTLARPEGKFTIQISEAQQNVPVDDAKFIMPASPSPGASKADTR